MSGLRYQHDRFRFPHRYYSRKTPQGALFAERDSYLTHLLENGCRRRSVRNVASMLLNVVRVLELDTSRAVGMDEILRGCDRWLSDKHARRLTGARVASSNTFRLVAINWLRFQNSLIPPDAKPAPLFGAHLFQFLSAMHSERGLASATLESYRRRILDFIIWLQSRCSEFSDVRASDVEDYLEGKRPLLRSSVASYCSALRIFFRYAEQHHWCRSGIPGIISSPRAPRVVAHLKGPSWDDVRRALGSIGCRKASDLRAKAMLMLLSIYGLRSCEVRGLTLDDIDWRRGLLTVRRTKVGKIQQFPLQSEVGEAIASYLEKARPKCSYRRLFVTIMTPFRPISGHSMDSIVSPRLKRITGQQFGPHSLRRACATQLLSTGTSLTDIADFLGHSNLRTVSNYARCEPAFLTKVAKFSLRGVL
jgi:integrase/recombinase XerD